MPDDRLQDARSRSDSALSRRGGGASRLGDALEAGAFYALLVGLALAPVWFGGDRLIVWGLSAAWFGGACLVLETGVLLSGRSHPVHPRRLLAPGLMMAVVAGWMFLQMSAALPRGHQHALWAMAGEALGMELAGAVSVAPDQTALALLRLATAVGLFWIALQTCREPRRARRLVAALGGIGAAYAVYGLVAFFAFPNTLLWFPKVFYADSLTSTFVNRNSYATYAGIGLVCALSLALGPLAGTGVGDWRGRLMTWLAALTGPGGFWLGAAFVIAMALALTGSRGGVAASVGGAVLLSALWGLRGRSRPGALALALGGAFVLVGGALFAFGDFLADRLTAQGLASEDRLAVYGLTAQSIADAPLTGFGYGAFAQSFPMYRDATVGPFGVWDRAHNTYLETLHGLGAPVTAAFLLALAWLAGQCLAAGLRRAHAATAPLAAAAATAIVGLHALVDFSLQVQGVALTWVALLGAGVAQSWSSRVATSR